MGRQLFHQVVRHQRVRQDKGKTVGRNDTCLCDGSRLLRLLRPLQRKELDGGGWHGEPLLQAIKV